MAKKSALSKSKGSPVSQVLIGLTLIIIVVAAFEAVTQNDITTVAPTQLFVVAGVLGMLGLYLKDEK